MYIYIHIMSVHEGMYVCMCIMCMRDFTCIGTFKMYILYALLSLYRYYYLTYI